MSRASTSIIVAGTAVALAVAAYLAFFRTTPAPEVTFATLRGESISTASLRGKVVLVNFWATSCVTCVKETPMLVETFKKFQARGFETLAVAMSYDPPNYVLAYAERNALPFKVALDPRGEIARRFGDVRQTPTTFVIDKRGNIVEQYLGEPNFGALHALLERKLAEADY
jgi:peroxiredoxin